MRFLVRVLTVVALLVMTQSAWSNPVCSAKDFSGTYAFMGNGLVLIPDFPLDGPMMRIGLMQADGKGTMGISAYAVYNGVNLGAEAYEGEFTVDADCGVHMYVHIPPPVGSAHFNGWLANDGSDVAVMITEADPGFPPAITTVVGYGRRQEMKKCSTADLRGSYRMELEGFVGLSPAIAYKDAPAWRQTGRLMLDGRGTFAASFITSNAGDMSVQADVTGTYTVSPNCTFDLLYTFGGPPFNGTDLDIRGSIIGHGEEAFIGLIAPTTQVLFDMPVNGTVATGNMVKQKFNHAAVH